MSERLTASDNSNCLLALDAGTGSIRAVIFTASGEQLAVGQAEWQHLAVDRKSVV